MLKSTQQPDLRETFGSAEALWSRLGLNEGEALRVLDDGPRTILLERVSELAGSALPVAGPPVLGADVARFPIRELFEWIESGVRSGLLYFVHREQAKAIYLKQGEVVFATSNQLVDRLGESLLRAGAIQLEQLREAQRCYSRGSRLGKVLVERGFLTPRELWNGVKYQVEEIVRSLFAYQSGRVYFWEGEFQPDNVVRLSLPTRRLADEGIQRRDELHKFLAVLEDPRVQLSVSAAVEGELSGSERALVDEIPREPRFAALCERLGMHRESAARSLQLLRLVGAVKLVRGREEGAPPEPPPKVDAAEEALRGLVETAVKVIAGLAAPIADVEQDDGVRVRMVGTLEDAARRFPELLGDLEVGARGCLDPEPLIERALRLDGDREATILAALGELVAYLEFEIMNHPAIDDPGAALAGVADLRVDLGL